MKIRDTVHISIENFRNRKSRTFLTILGVGVGIGAVLFLVSLGYGLQKILLERITTAESFLTLDIASADSKAIILNDSSLRRVYEVGRVETVSPQAILPGQIIYKELTAETTHNIVDDRFFGLNGVLPQYGRAFSRDDRGMLVINSRVAELFNLKPEEALGQLVSLVTFVASDDEQSEGGTEIVVLPAEFEIIGVFEDTDGAGQIYISRADVPQIVIGEYQFAKVKVKEDKDLEYVREELISMGFVVSAISDIVDQANKIFRVIQIVLGIFGVIAVVVAAISLANTMTISILERTQDIGTMRSIGGSREDIRNLFLIESTLIGFTGGVVGIVLGFVVGFIFNNSVRLLARLLGGRSVDLFHTPIWFIIFILIFSTSVGFLTGILPARRASSLHPLRALRYK